MEEPRAPEPPASPPAPDQPIRYVGGLGEVPRGPAWPFIVLGLIPLVLVIALVAWWNPIRSLGRSAGATIAPYSLFLTGASWSSDQKIVGVPVTFSLGLDNVDKRAIKGLTMKFTKLDSRWEIIDASSPQTSAQINGSSIFFPDVVKPGSSTTLAVRFLADKAMDTEIDFTLTPGDSSTPAHVQLRNGSSLSTLAIDGKVRDPIESDANAWLTAIYDTHIVKGQLAVWQIHVANTGPIAINGIRLKFTDIPSGFDFRAETSATVLPDGQTVQFDTTLPPGGQTILLIGLTPQITGHYQIPIEVYLGQSTAPLSSANGGPPLSLDLTVQ
ncbi:MAG TPA: hypothetical protein VFR68_14240 [Candidatus Dormibacteraeota bacterium]|nr:hypothetical protein [Candidatus Dormibacteraeota bacterium]